MSNTALEQTNSVRLAFIVKQWLVLASQYIGAQVGIRATSMLGAIVLVNLLPVSEYGVYTLLLANLTFLNGVSDFGATGSLFYFWRRAKRRLPIFRAYLVAVLRLRSALFIASAVASVLYLVLITSLKKYDSWTLLFGTALMLLATWYLVRVGTWLAVLRIEGRFMMSYAVEAVGEMTKLLVVGGIWVTGLRFAAAGMTAVLAGAAASFFVLARFIAPQLRFSSVPPRSRSRHVLVLAVRQQVLPTAPWTLFFVAQGPLLAWLAAAFGSSQNLGEIGALGRLSSIISLVSGFTVGVLVPRLSNVHDEKRFFNYYLSWWVVLASIGGTLLALIYLWPHAMLWMIGHQYRELGAELLIALATAVIMTFEWYAGCINRTRGWIGGQVRRIGAILIGQAAMIPFLDFSHTRDLLLFSMGTAALTLTVQLAYNILGFCGAHRARRAAHAN